MKTFFNLPMILKFLYKVQKSRCPDLQAILNASLKIQKMADEDKAKHNKEKLEKVADIKTNWKHIKDEKKTYAPKFIKQKDRSGNKVKWGNLAEATADYLANIQFKIAEVPPGKINPRKVILRDLGIDAGEIISQNYFKW